MESSSENLKNAKLNLKESSESIKKAWNDTKKVK